MNRHDNRKVEESEIVTIFDSFDECIPIVAIFSLFWVGMIYIIAFIKVGV